jgi:NodT family efflux transporter outer membrane factor (OMF) lipoprotein
MTQPAPLPHGSTARATGARAGRTARRLGAAALLGLAAGCTVGPDFLTPAAPDAPGYTPEPVAATASAPVRGGESQRFVQDMDIPAQWWVMFNSPELVALVERALQANPNIAAAQAALKAALETAYAQMGAYLPAVDGSFSPSRQKTSSALSPVPAQNINVFSLYTAQLSLSYTPDVFGLNRRTVESLQAQAENQRFQLEATYLTLASNVVVAAVQEASLRAQIRATEAIIAFGREALGLLRRQLSAGAVAGLDVAAQEAQVAQNEAILAPLQKQLAIQRNLLAALAGALPSQPPAETFELERLSLPQDLPVSVPAKLVQQRPDVRAAEASLHSASAQIGVAVANRLPNLTLSAAWGTTALRADSLFGSGTGFYTLSGQVLAPIFEGFSLLHRERAARALFDQAAAQYRGAVITAFQNVADTLRALQYDADALMSAAAAERASLTQLEITRRQLELGQINYLSLIQAQQTYLTAVIARVQAQANRYADAAALFQALGGGWWNRPEQPQTAVSIRNVLP